MPSIVDGQHHTDARDPPPKPERRHLSPEGDSGTGTRLNPVGTPSMTLRNPQQIAAFSMA
jgi:hypothetical protein